MWNILLTIVLAVHGMIHLLGFVVPWRLAHVEELPYKTTILAGRLDIGDTGIRLPGMLWLAATIGFVAAALGLAIEQRWWYTLAVVTATLSLIITVTSWPEASPGTVISVFLLALLLAGPRVAWLASRFHS